MWSPRYPWSSSTPIALHALLLSRVERAEAAAAGHLEDDLRAPRDLVERDLLALRLVDEVLRVPVKRLDLGIGLLGARLEAGDIVVHRRDLLAADGGDHLGVVVLRPQRRRGSRPDSPPSCSLNSRPLDVLGLVLQGGSREVDDREVGVRHLGRDGVRRVRHEEADRDDQVELLLSERRQVRDVVTLLLRDEHPLLDPQLVGRALDAGVGQLVERAVVDPADVGDDTRLDCLPLLSGLVAATAVATTVVVVVVAAPCDPKHERYYERQQDRAKLPIHAELPS